MGLLDGWFDGGKGASERRGWREEPIRYGETWLTLNTEKADEAAARCYGATHCSFLRHAAVWA